MKILNKSIVYQSGKDGYQGYRIPSIIMAKNGALLSFCEGRFYDLGDSGYIDIIVKKSLDNGASWTTHKTVIGDEKNTFGNCCCIVDEDTSRIHMICNFNYASDNEMMIINGEASRKACYLYSDDDGDTWSKPRDITTQVSSDSWGWLAFGPCHGIQTKTGRVVFPSNHTYIKEKAEITYYSYAVYSDDGCRTFQYGEDVAKNTNECAIARLDNDTLYINMRSYEKDNRRRRAYSLDEGQTWVDYEKDNVLIDPICQGSVLNIDGKGLVAVCNNTSKNRENLTLRLSKNDGKSWYEDIVIYEGPSAYSDLVFLSDNKIGCLYEYGDEHCYQYIGFATIEFD